MCRSDSEGSGNRHWSRDIDSTAKFGSYHDARALCRKEYSRNHRIQLYSSWAPFGFKHCFCFLDTSSVQVMPIFLQRAYVTVQRLRFVVANGSSAMFCRVLSHLVNPNSLRKRAPVLKHILISCQCPEWCQFYLHMLQLTGQRRCLPPDTQLPTSATPVTQGPVAGGIHS